MATLTMAVVSTASSPSQSFLPASICRHRLAPLDRRMPAFRFVRSREESLHSIQSLVNFQPLSSLKKSTSSRSTCVDCLPTMGFMWRGIWKSGENGVGRVCLAADQIESSETVEGKIVGLVGGGDGGISNGDGGGSGNGDGGGKALRWISSALVFAFYSALVYYAAVLAPAQNPSRDQYLILKLVGLRSNDGLTINTILFCVFYGFALWPVIYGCLLLPSARNKKGGVPAWPFLLLSFVLGGFGLYPYFGLWHPPSPKVTRDELQKFPLNVLEKKLVVYVALLLGAGFFLTAAFAGAAQWTEMLQLFRESKFVNVLTIDSLSLSALAPIWVYNDMATRRWLDKGSWLLPLSLVPYFGPVLYLVLRPPLPLSMVADES